MRTVAAAIAGLCTPRASDCNSRGRLMADLSSHECRFPLYGEGVATRFCAVEIAPADWNPGFSGGSYCPFHRQLSRGRGTESERSAVRVLERALRLGRAAIFARTAPGEPLVFRGFLLRLGA